jgi:hypothetical protein
MSESQDGLVEEVVKDFGTLLIFCHLSFLFEQRLNDAVCDV